MFQFLIGSLGTAQTQEAENADAGFQFLIGSLGTKIKDLDSANWACFNSL